MYFSTDNVQQIQIQTKESHALLLDDSATPGTHFYKAEKYACGHFYVLLQLI